MVDHFTETSRTGLMGNLGKSLAMVPIGLLLFFGSFVMIWFTSGRTDYSKIAAMAEEAAADTAGGVDGRLVAVTGSLAAPGTLGDPEFLAPGEYVRLDRRAEMFAWDERVESKEKKNAGGSSTTTKEYHYDKDWTSSPDDSSEFRHPEGHRNPPMTVAPASFTAESVTVGAWTLRTTELGLPGGSPLSLEGAKLQGKALSAKRQGDTLFLGKGSLEAPQIGDIRVSFTALGEGGRVTAFGEALGKELAPYVHKGEDTLYRVLDGTKDQAVATLKAEYSTLGKVLYGVAFVLMWMGMTMVFAPLHGVMDILPFMGKVSRGLVGCITLPIAMVLSAVTITLSVIAHSPVVLAILLIALAGGGFFLYQRKKAAG